MVSRRHTLLAIGLDTLMTALAGWQRCQDQAYGTCVLGDNDAQVLGIIVYAQENGSLNAGHSRRWISS